MVVLWAKRPQRLVFAACHSTGLPLLSGRIQAAFHRRRPGFPGFFHQAPGRYFRFSTAGAPRSPWFSRSGAGFFRRPCAGFPPVFNTPFRMIPQTFHRPRTATPRRLHGSSPVLAQLFHGPGSLPPKPVPAPARASFPAISKTGPQAGGGAPNSCLFRSRALT